jgi:hypothetical protein
MAGFDAPSGQSMIAAGETRIAAYDRALDRLPVDPRAMVALARRTRAGELTFRDDAKSGTFSPDLKPWSISIASLWSAVRTHRAQLDALLAANQELYLRYLALHALHGYFETARPSSDAPFVYVSPQVQALFLAAAADALQSGTPAQRQAALRDLRQDLQMWKTVLQGDGGLLSKMLAATALHTDLLVLGAMVSDPDCDLTSLGAEVRSLLVPFPTRVWRIGNVYDFEMRSGLTTTRIAMLGPREASGSDLNPARWPQMLSKALLRQFFKFNATANLQARLMEQLRALADGDPTTFSRRLQAYQKWRRHHIVAGLYDPVGKLLLQIGAPLYADEPPRVYDVAAFQRLVYLAYQIRHQRIAIADVAGFMQAHPQWATSPLDAKPFHWDPATRRLSVVPAAPEHRSWSFGLKIPSNPSHPAAGQASRPQRCRGPRARLSDAAPEGRRRFSTAPGGPKLRV